MAERNIRQELNDARIAYQELRFEQSRINDDVAAAKNRMTYTRGLVDNLVSEGKQDTAAYRNNVRTYNEAKKRYDDALAKLNDVKSRADAAKQKMDGLDKEIRSERDTAAEAERRKDKADTAKSEAAALRVRAQTERDLGNTAEAVRLENEAREKDAEAVTLSKPAPVTPAAPATPSPTPAAGAAANEIDWSHGLKPDPNKQEIVWQNANGSWGKKSYVAISEKIGKDKNLTQRIVKILKDSGVSDANLDDFEEIRQQWVGLAQRSMSVGVSPSEYTKYVATFNLPGAGLGDGTGGPRVNITISEQTPLGLQNDINQAFVDSLGRNATWKEVVAITKQVNAEIKRNPSKTVTTGNTTRVTGFGEAELANFIKNAPKKMPEYKKQRGESFTDWVERATSLDYEIVSSDPGLARVRSLWMAGNEDDAFRALENLELLKNAKDQQRTALKNTASQNLRAYANDMGVRFDTEAASKSIADGLSTEDFYKTQIANMAKERYPGAAAAIDAGGTLRSAYSPYLYDMADLWGVPYENIDLNSPEVADLINYRDDAGNYKYMPASEWMFKLRSSSLYSNSERGRNELMSAFSGMLKDLGLG